MKRSTEIEPRETISGSEVMELLGITRRRLGVLIEEGKITPVGEGRRKRYSRAEIAAFMQTDEYEAIATGTRDSRNTLNDLTGKEWLPETKSFFYQKGLGPDSADAQIERLHPAPFSFQDIGRLVRFFTKKGMSVLDPFGGVGSTAKACEIEGRICTSIELSKKWHDLAIKRLDTEVRSGASKNHVFMNEDACEALKRFESSSFDFIVTSPPYWGILNKQDQKVKRGRVAHNLETKYSENDRDLGNIDDYPTFLDVLVLKVFMECGRVLKPKKYMAIIVSDFRDKSDYYSFHSDLIRMLNNSPTEDGYILKLQGTKILLQNHKTLLPYGYPFAYVENIHHQYVLIFRKMDD